MTISHYMTYGLIMEMDMGTSERRSRERKQREEQIVNAAEKVFFECGFDNSTMDDVAGAAELSKGALYTYFKTKNELCICIVSRALRLVLAGFEKVYAAENLNGLKMIYEAGMSFRHFYNSHPKYYCALLSYRHHRGGCGAESRFLQNTLDENRRINELLGAMLRKGMEDGSIRGSIEPSGTALTLWGELGGLIPGFILNGDAAGGTDFFEQALDLICRGLSGNNNNRR